MKLMLATDADTKKLKYPLCMQPKIDGVRAAHLTPAGLTGRNLKPHANLHTTKVFSNPLYLGLDGEMANGDWTAEDLCRRTTSAMNTIAGEPELTWHVFDYVNSYTYTFGYRHRYYHLARRVEQLQREGVNNIHLVPNHYVQDEEGLLELEDRWLDLGFEGAIIRAVSGPYKEGRSTIREGYLLRIKRFIEEDAVVLDVVEGRTNLNEAKVNALGHTERSSHQENMVPNGMVGTLTCRLSKDVFDPRNLGNPILLAGAEITVSAGSMDHKDRLRYMKEPGLIIGKTIKFKMFPKGVKDKPRFPTFQSIRMESDK